MAIGRPARKAGGHAGSILPQCRAMILPQVYPTSVPPDLGATLT
jgi:hypothetical protein